MVPAFYFRIAIAFMIICLHSCIDVRGLANPIFLISTIIFQHKILHRFSETYILQESDAWEKHIRTIDRTNQDSLRHLPFLLFKNKNTFHKKFVGLDLITVD